MARPSSTHSPRQRIVVWTTAWVSLVLVGSLAIAPVVSSHALTNAWQAKIGSAGVNGTAKVQVFDTGIGTLTLKLAKLKASTSVPVVLHKGTCSSVGAVLLKLASIKTSSSGAAARTSNLSTSQVTLIKAATKGTARIAIRVASSTTGGVKCGLFAVVAVPPPPTPTVAATITVGPFPHGVAISPSGVWVANQWDGTLSRIDPVTNSILSTLTLSNSAENLSPRDLTYAAGSLWITVDEFDEAGENWTGFSVRRIDPVSGQSLATVKVGTRLADITSSPGAVWVSSFDGGTVSRIDTATNTVSATVTIGAGLVGIAFGEGSVWVANENTGTVSRIDPATNQVVATIPTVGYPEGLAAGAGAIWVTNWGTKGVADGVLSRIDPATNQVVRTIPLGINPFWVAFGGGYVWVAMDGEPTVVQVNPSTNAVQSRISTGQPVLGADGKIFGIWGLAASDHTVWVVQPQEVTRLNPLRGSLIRINY